MKKTISILGATGSVGTSAASVARKSSLKIDFISVDKNISGAEALVREFSIPTVAVRDEAAARTLRASLSDTDTRVLAGEEGILTGIMESKSEVTVNSILGMAGLKPTLAVIDAGKRLALANKESLVIAGDIVTSRARSAHVEILPVDSEHSAIFQSLLAGKRSEIKRIILTASGGPFYGKSRDDLKLVTPALALAHPTWKMGKKITVDSATLMNKGFEVIEAAHLFGVGAEKIEVVVHRESILHSAIEYIDNSIIGELSVPDMRSCVQYAVDYPHRTEAVIEPLDLFSVGTLSFMRPDYEAFPLLSLAKRTMCEGGAMGAVLNAADEVAVEAFLSGRLSFLGISEVVCEAFERMLYARDMTSLEDIFATDAEARRIASKIIGEFSK